MMMAMAMLMLVKVSLELKKMYQSEYIIILQWWLIVSCECVWQKSTKYAWFLFCGRRMDDCCGEVKVTFVQQPDI